MVVEAVSRIALCSTGVNLRVIYIGVAPIMQLRTIIKIVTFKGGHLKMVKMIFHTITNCP